MEEDQAEHDQEDAGRDQIALEIPQTAGPRARSGSRNR